MLKKITISKNLSYNKKVGYSNKMTFHDRLVKANAIDLRDNLKVENLENGYSKHYPVNSGKRIMQ